MKTVSIVFPEKHLEGLEELEKKFGLSRSELIRMSILDLLEKYFGGIGYKPAKEFASSFIRDNIIDSYGIDFSFGTIKKILITTIQMAEKEKAYKESAFECFGSSQPDIVGIGYFKMENSPHSWKDVKEYVLQQIDKAAEKNLKKYIKNYKLSPQELDILGEQINKVKHNERLAVFPFSPQL